MNRLWWLLIGSLLLHIAGAPRLLRPADAAEPRPGPGQTPKCVTVTPLCAHKPTETITFTFTMTNDFVDRTVRHVLCVDLISAIKIDVPPKSTKTKTMTMRVGSGTYRLNPKAWC